jgi:type IV pilus assembly protein PilB
MDQSQTSYRDHIESEIQKGADRSIIYLLECIIQDAHYKRASDIHIDVTPTSLQVRLRIDGVFENPYTLPLDCHTELMARLKILAGMRTDERFKPHDGRFTCKTESDLDIELRLSIMPTFYGENAVLRLPSTNSYQQTFTELGVSDEDQKLLHTALSRSYGLILITGPTGSGKTTTLYTLLHSLRESSRSLVTIEDPIEYALEGVTQVPVQPHYGVTFAQGLRSLLRQDPDVLMVGEIRDTETATLAVQAALTGHLVLSTLHTNDAHSALPRLIDMGIEPYMIASTVHLIVAQRLIRKNNDRGEVKGRIGIFEFLSVTEEMRQALSKNSFVLTQSPEFKGLRDDGLEKVRSGIISLEELNKILHA